MVEANVPLLAMPSGSILQFLLMTVPLLCVYLYFLFLAYERPSIADPDNPKFAEDRIRLMDILYTFLATLILFSSLVVYMLWFVRERRSLSKRYEKEGVIILGDVRYTESYYDLTKLEDSDATGFFVKVYRVMKNFCFIFTAWIANGLTLRNNYGYVVYDLERVANHPACDYEARNKGTQLSGIITKKVRVYHRYPREQVSILVLPKYPNSGQPKADMEADWASFSKYVGGLPSQEQDDEMDDGRDQGGNTILPKRDRILGVLLVSIFWVGFLVIGSYYVVDRIEVVDDVYNDEDATKAWTVFWTVIGGVVPLVAILGNYIRWKLYESWMLHSGSKKTMGGRRESEVEEQGGAYIQMR